MSCSDLCIRRRAWPRMAAIVVALASGLSASGAEPVRLTTDGTLKLAPVFIRIAATRSRSRRTRCPTSCRLSASS